MTKKIVFGVAVFAFAVFMMAPSASASCTPNQDAGTGVSSYWFPTVAGGAGEGTLVGQTWQLGAPGNWSLNGSDCAGTPWIYFYPGASDGASVLLNLGSCGSGCPSAGGTLAVLAQNTTPAGTDFLLATVVATPAGVRTYDYEAQGSHNMIKIPRPRVISSSRTGNLVNLNVQFDSIAGGLYGPNAATGVTGFRLLKKGSATDPGRDAASYDAAPAASVASPGGAQTNTGVAIDCTNPLSQYLVTQIVFENGSVLSGAVSDATRVSCDPAVANPKYKIVPKRIGTPQSDPQ